MRIDTRSQVSSLPERDNPRPGRNGRGIAAPFVGSAGQHAISSIFKTTYKSSVLQRTETAKIGSQFLGSFVEIGSYTPILYERSCDLIGQKARPTPVISGPSPNQKTGHEGRNDSNRDDRDGDPLPEYGEGRRSTRSTLCEVPRNPDHWTGRNRFRTSRRFEDGFCFLVCLPLARS